MINNYLREHQKEFCVTQEGAEGKMKENITASRSSSDLKGQKTSQVQTEGLFQLHW